MPKSQAVTSDQAAENIFGLLSDETEAEETAESEEEVTDEVDETESDEVDEEAPEEEEEEEQEPFFTVKIDGQDTKVSRSKLVEGYQKNAASMKRFEEAAELRKQAQQQTEQAQKSLQIADYIVNAFQPREPDTALEEDDPAEYGRQMRHVRDWEKIRTGLHGKMREFEARQAEEVQARTREQAELTKDAFTHEFGLKSDEEIQGAGKQLVSYLQNQYGATREELQGLGAIDHRFLVMMEKARRYDLGRKKGRAAIEAKRTPQSIRTLKPGAATNTRRDVTISKGKKLLRQTGHARDAASIIEKLGLAD